MTIRVEPVSSSWCSYLEVVQFFIKIYIDFSKNYSYFRHLYKRKKYLVMVYGN